MPKVVTSPVKRFPGTVTLCDPLTLEAAITWEEKLSLVYGQDHEQRVEAAAQKEMLPAIRICVEAWNIPSFDLANPPGSPMLSRSRLIGWLIDEIHKLYVSEELDGDPNALSPEPMPTA